MANFDRSRGKKEERDRVDEKDSFGRGAGRIGCRKASNIRFGVCGPGLFFSSDARQPQEKTPDPGEMENVEHVHHGFMSCMF